MDRDNKTPYTPLQRLVLMSGNSCDPKTDAARLRRFGSSRLAGSTQHDTQHCNPSARTFLSPISPIVQYERAWQPCRSTEHKTTPQPLRRRITENSYSRRCANSQVLNSIEPYAASQEL